MIRIKFEEHEQEVELVNGSRWRDKFGKSFTLCGRGNMWIRLYDDHTGLIVGLYDARFTKLELRECTRLDPISPTSGRDKLKPLTFWRHRASGDVGILIKGDSGDEYGTWFPTDADGLVVQTERLERKFLNEECQQVYGTLTFTSKPSES